MDENYTVADCVFQVGDKVIVSDDVRHCAFGVNREMIFNIGEVHEVQCVEVLQATPRVGRHRSRFKIQLLDDRWTYDEMCFEPTTIADRVFDDGDMSILFS